MKQPHTWADDGDGIYCDICGADTPAAAMRPCPAVEPSTDCEDICMERCQGPCGVL